jgi:hypothetical protein
MAWQQPVAHDNDPLAVIRADPAGGGMGGEGEKDKEN